MPDVLKYELRRHHHWGWVRHLLFLMTFLLIGSRLFASDDIPSISIYGADRDRKIVLASYGDKGRDFMNNHANVLAPAVIIAMLLVIAGWASAADPAPSKQPRRSAPLVSAHAVAIRNDAGQPMSFYLSGCDKPGKEWSIKNRAMEEFPCRRSCDICVFTTQDIRVSYTLQEQSRYRIYWNSERNRWDVSALSSITDE